MPKPTVSDARVSAVVTGDDVPISAQEVAAANDERAWSCARLKQTLCGMSFETSLLRRVSRHRRIMSNLQTRITFSHELAKHDRVEQVAIIFHIEGPKMADHL